MSLSNVLSLFTMYYIHHVICIVQTEHNTALKTFTVQSSEKVAELVVLNSALVGDQPRLVAASMAVSTLSSSPSFLARNKWLFAVLVLITTNLVLYYAVSVHVRSSMHGIQIANNAATISKELSSRSERAGLNVQAGARSQQPQINPETNSGWF